MWFGFSGFSEFSGLGSVFGRTFRGFGGMVLGFGVDRGCNYDIWTYDTNNEGNGNRLHRCLLHPWCRFRRVEFGYKTLGVLRFCLKLALKYLCQSY